MLIKQNFFPHTDLVLIFQGWGLERLFLLKQGWWFTRNTCLLISYFNAIIASHNPVTVSFHKDKGMFLSGEFPELILHKDVFFLFFFFQIHKRQLQTKEFPFHWQFLVLETLFQYQTKYIMNNSVEFKTTNLTIGFHQFDIICLHFSTKNPTYLLSSTHHCFIDILCLFWTDFGKPKSCHKIVFVS